MCEMAERSAVYYQGVLFTHEKKCLRILLKGSQPIVICLARGIWKRFPLELKEDVGENLH